MKLIDRLKTSLLLEQFLKYLMFCSGALLALIPILFWDFLITYQFRPTVRPFYFVIYGALFAGGMGILILFVLSLLPKFRFRKPLSGKWYDFLLPAVNIIAGVVVFAAFLKLYITTEYLAADKLFWLISCGLLMGGSLLVLLSGSGAIAVLYLIKKREVDHTVRLANYAVIPFLIAFLLAGTVIIAPPDAQEKSFPDDLPYVTTLFAQGDAGYHTFKIPTMITAADGSVLVFAEARADNQEDWGKMDIVVRRSTDKGDTWSPIEVVIADGQNTMGNACPVVDRNTGFLWLIFCKENDTVYKTHSEDNGITWEPPIEITASVKRPNWSWYATGPANGIQLSDGTLMIPADHIEGRSMQSHVIFSKDGGATWELGGTVKGGEEATIVELDNGNIYLNTRPVKPGYRVTAVSCDKGLTWIERKNDTALPDPACEGSLIKVEREARNIYLFSNAADKLHREKMTVRLSVDGCKTWAYSKTIYPGLASYSALSMLDTDTASCVFECGANYYAERIVFTRFPLSYIAPGL